MHALYATGDADRAWRTLRAMLTGPEAGECRQRGQLPVFVPNYYRGAWRLHPRTAGRSSQLFNTGTAAWLYRCVVESLLGLRGEGDGLRIAPQLPSHWPGARVRRHFRGARVDVENVRVPGLRARRVLVDGRALGGDAIAPVEPGRHYVVRVELPG